MKLLSITLLLVPVFSLWLTACAQHPETSQTFQQMNQTQTTSGNEKQLDTATFGAGCFWCTEAQFQQLDGVMKVESGYAGGHVKNPTYKQVCTGNTGHAEVTNIYYDPSKISFDELLAAFWIAHDPTQLNRQGNDIGTQYRSVIYYHNDEQRQKAESYKAKLNAEKAYSSDVVTEISPFPEFYKAEDYHQNYYNDNASQPYCMMVIRPKMDKFEKVFKNKLKKKN
ncbi:MAG TPA: peptide-methionine (S)-S-oxide reductase MsrA [Flavipsychrobacter sp.]|nr:peptide-methionine (S)-S-oxide reductase MsrA [Flavipsychrobacter sp.]